MFPTALTSTLLLTLLSTIRFTSATQTTGVPGGVYLCSKPNWKGQCEWIEPKAFATSCRENNPNLSAKSLGPDPGTICTTYSDPNCKAGTMIDFIMYPGIADGLADFRGLSCGKMLV